MAVTITAEPANIIFDFRANYNVYPPKPRDPTLDRYFDCYERGIFTEISVEAFGDYPNQTFMADPVEIQISPIASLASGVIIDAGAAQIIISPQSGDILLEHPKSHWVKWSNIGSLDFTIGRDNVAGEMPLDWSGWVYEIKKLASKVIVYGENGVSILTPSDKFYGMETILWIGLHSPGAIVGTDHRHFFIDKLGRMWKFEKDLELLDYSEFFSDMSDIIMSYDVQNDLIYICDGTYGYVYSPESRSLGKGPVNITGLGVRDGELFIVSSATIETPTFEICTDIYDLGTRKFKTIRSIEVGTDLTENMEASIDYRVSNKVPFANIGWHPVTLEGISHMTCYGLEFRFRLRVQTYEYFEIDYLKLNGLIHNYSYTEHKLHSISERRRIMYDS